jgi:hypothetical protein
MIENIVPDSGVGRADSHAGNRAQPVFHLRYREIIGLLVISRQGQPISVRR